MSSARNYTQKSTFVVVVVAVVYDGIFEETFQYCYRRRTLRGLKHRKTLYVILNIFTLVDTLTRGLSKTSKVKGKTVCSDF